MMKPHQNPPHKGGLLFLLPLVGKGGMGFSLNFRSNDNRLKYAISTVSALLYVLIGSVS